MRSRSVGVTVGCRLVGGALLVASFASPARVEAQSSNREVMVGVQGGFSSADVRGSAVSDGGEPLEFGASSGFAIGLLLTTGLHTNATLQPEIFYVRNAVDVDLGVAGAIAEVTVDYIQVPVLVKLHGQRRAGAVPFAIAGPVFSFLSRARQRAELMGVVETEDLKDDLTSVDVGVAFGGGVDFVQDWGTVTVDGRYTLGLRNLDESGEDDLKLGTFLVMAGVVF